MSPSGGLMKVGENNAHYFIAERGRIMTEEFQAEKAYREATAPGHTTSG